MTDMRPSIIVESRHCPADWLASVLRQRLLGRGEQRIEWDPTTRDVRAVEVDERDRDITGAA